MIIGFSTGCFFHTWVPFDERIRVYRDCGANALELSFPKVNDLLYYGLSPEVLEIINQFDFVSIHAPWLDIQYCVFRRQVIEIFEKIESLCCHIENVKGISFHFDVIGNFSLLEDLKKKLDIPVLVENMDPAKKSGKRPRDFGPVKEHGLGTVLDLYHLYEVEKLELAGNFPEIGYIHMSGEKEERHALLYSAYNRKIIMKTSLPFRNLPIILEGKIEKDFKGNFLEELKKELKYVSEGKE